MKKSLFEAIGGLSTMERVHTHFYDAVYAHPWIGQFFVGHDQAAIELRQTQFMAEKMGADIKYPGMDLDIAHRRMYISEALLKLRQQLLRKALEDERLETTLVEQWLRIDQAFWRKIENKSLDSFHQVDLKYEKPVIIDEPVLASQ